jgi:hypothetical protein
VAVVIKVSYGVDVLEDDDPYIKIANDAMYATGNGGTPQNSIVDMFPPGKATRLRRGKAYQLWSLEIGLTYPTC